MGRKVLESAKSGKKIKKVVLYHALMTVKSTVVRCEIKTKNIRSSTVKVKSRYFKTALKIVDLQQQSSRARQYLTFLLILSS